MMATVGTVWRVKWSLDRDFRPGACNIFAGTPRAVQLVNCSPYLADGSVLDIPIVHNDIVYYYYYHNITIAYIILYDVPRRRSVAHNMC